MTRIENETDAKGRILPVGQNTGADSTEDLEHVLFLLDQAQRQGFVALLLYAVLLIFLPFFIVILVFAGVPPTPLFILGVLSGSLSVILLFGVMGLAGYSTSLGFRALDASSRLAAGTLSLPAEVRWTPRLGALMVGLGVATLVAFGISGSLAGSPPATYWTSLRLTSIVLTVTLGVSATLIGSANKLLRTLTRIAPVKPEDSATRALTISTWLAWFAVSPGLVFIFGTMVRYPSWVEGWPVFLGLISPLAASVAFGRSRSVFSNWRKWIRDQASEEKATPQIQSKSEVVRRWEPKDFDLHLAARIAKRRAASNQVFYLAVAAMVTIFAIFILTPPYHQPFGVILLLAGVLFAMVTTMVVSAFLRNPKAPLDDLNLTRNGVTLHFMDSVTLDLAWTDPNFGLTFRDFSIDPSSTNSETEWIWLQAPRGRSGFVTPESVSAVVDAALAQGLPVLRRQEVVPGYKVAHTTITTRVGRLEATPGFVRPWRNPSGRPQ